jgi:BMFP domain-containing protein YqiC
MQKDHAFFEDMAKLASAAAGNMLEARREMEALMLQKFEKLFQSMNLSTREENDALREMVVKLREEQEELKKRITALEQGQ